MIIVIISNLSPYQLDKNYNNKFRPVPWTQNLAEYLAKINSNTVYVISAISPRENFETYSIVHNDVHYKFFKHSGRFTLKLNYLYEVFRIKKIIKEINPDIVHGQGIEGFAGMAALKSNYPNVITIHGIINEIHKTENSNLKQKKLELKVLRSIKNIISINPFVKDSIQNLVSDTEFKKINFKNIMNLVPNNYFALSKNKNKIINICFSGVLYPRKGLMDLLKALKKIEDESLKYKLIICGIYDEKGNANNYYTKCKKFIETNLNCDIVFNGFVHPYKMIDIYKNIDLNVLPSKAETAPMSISEVSSLGIPTIAYNVGGIKNMIKNGKSGFVIQTNDIESLFDKIKLLIQNTDLLEECGLNAKKFALENFHSKKIIKDTMEFYKEIIG